MLNQIEPELKRIISPMESFISKSEKAREKLVPGSWQHTSLGNDLQALRIGLALLTGETQSGQNYTSEALQTAVGALESLINRVGNTKTKFSPGTAQHSLQRNRLEALQAAKATIKSALEKH